MSGAKTWTDLPKEIGQDFVSITGDYDYPLYISEKEEWVNYKHIKGGIVVMGPMLIMELNRLVPFLAGDYVQFHVLNMPHVKIKKIEIIGFVVAVSENVRCYMYQVDDGTGSITINYDRKHFDQENLKRKAIDEKYLGHARNINSLCLKGQECPKRSPDPRPQFNYPVGTSQRDMAILEHKWSLETKNGLLGEQVKLRDYVHAVGYCMLDLMFAQRPREEITFEHLSNSKISFMATKVTRIEEHEYNAKMYSWLYKVVRKRYDEDPNKPEFIPKDAT